MDDAAPQIEPETLALRALQTAMSDAEAALGRRMRMHPTDLAAMGHLTWSDDPVGPGELGHRLGLSPAAATELVDRLTAAGHVERHRDLADRRRIRLEATPHATGAVLEHLDALIAGLDAAARDLTAEDRQVVQRFLARAIDVYAAWSEDAPD
ncbi:MarR family winged helix-turn-helix transcriptional regulator [uncultured Amnibacterium sp.]|uniref:MarR family winged helix-turn-helix transcriptional regulator n=1 Tax=uncultured Amnibacterium sp. TaxID=1631851 RepID=UPI0035CBF2F2